MQKWITCIALILCVAVRVSAQDSYADKVEKYVKQYKDLAIAEQQRCGIPAAVTLGQGILETEAGCSELATQANNHFGIKCKRDWKGETFAHTDDAPDECFRKYDCAASSYKDHSNYLKNTPRYASLFKLSPTDYSAWALGLKKCGYATSPTYAVRLINIIQQFNLQDYTYVALNDMAAHGDKNVYASAIDSPDFEKIKEAADEAHATIVAKPLYAAKPGSTVIHKDYDGIITVNGLKAIYAHKGDALLQYAMKYNIRYEKLLEMNDLPDAPLKEDMYVFLERKAIKGWHAIHIVAPGENIHSISQEEGVQLKKLMAYNHLEDGQEPVAGSMLHLQDYAESQPKLALQQQPTTQPQQVNTVGKNTDDYITKPIETAGNNTVDDDNTVGTGNTATTKNADDDMVAGNAETPVATNVTAPAKTSHIVVNNNADDAKTPATTEPAQTKPDNIVADNNADDAKTPATTEPVQAKPNNIVADNNTYDAAPVAKESVKKEVPAQGDDLDKLKAQLDKIVYAGDNNNTPTAATNTETDAAPVTAASEAPKKTKEASITEQPEHQDVVASSSNIKGTYYTVKKGDTAFSIAKRNSLTVHQLMLMNNLDFDGIKIGQRLRIK